MPSDLRFILTATRTYDNARLHLVDRGIDSGSSGFVVCWNYDKPTGSWDWGTYCDDLKSALSIFTKKCEEHEFDEVFEGYLDRQN
jgi:hypothetical protein